MRLPLYLIAACFLATTFDWESTPDDNGINIYFGNFAYHFQGSN